MEMFKNAIKYKENYFDAYYNLGCVYMELGYYKKAIELFENLKSCTKDNIVEIEERIKECNNLIKQVIFSKYRYYLFN